MGECPLPDLREPPTAGGPASRRPPHRTPPGRRRNQDHLVGLRAAAQPPGHCGSHEPDLPGLGGVAGLDWITALRVPQVKKLVRDGAPQLTLFDIQDLAEITSSDFPGERRVACMNRFLEAEQARKREALLTATEADLEKKTAACARARRPLGGQDKIELRVGKVLNRRKVAKHFTIAIGEDRFSYHQNQDSIAAEAALDGI